jgi:hypothetical protein
VVNQMGSQGGGSYAGFTGWYVDFSAAEVGSYRWSAPAHWNQPSGAPATGTVEVVVDVTA